MAFTNLGAGATTPGNPDYRFALHTREGVKDVSGIGDELGKQIDYQLIESGVQAAGALTKDLYVGYQKRKLQDEMTEGAIDPFLASMEPNRNAAVAESAGVLQGLQGQEEGLFNALAQGGSSETFEKGMQANIGSVKRETGKITTALKQGQMTQQEFELRLRRITREAINRNPGLSQELLQHAQLVEHQSGIRLIPDVKQQVDKAAMQQAKRQLDFKYAQHKQAGTYIGDPSRYENDPEYAAHIDKQTEQWFRGKSYLDALDQNQKTGEYFDKAEAKENVGKLGTATQAVFHDFISAAHGMAASADTPQKKAELNAQLETYRANLIVSYRKQLTDNKFPRQNVNDHLSMLDKMTGNVLEAVAKDTSGQPLADILNRQLDIQKTASELQLRHNFPTDVFKFAKSLPPSMQAEFDRKLRDNPDKDKIMGGLFSAISGYNSKDALSAITGRNISGDMTDAAYGFKASIAGENNEDAEQLLAAINLHTVRLKESNFPADLTEKVKAQESIIAEMAKPNYKGKLNFGATANRHAMDITRDYLVDAGTLFRRDVDKYNRDPSSTIRIFTKLNKDGQMEIYGEGGDRGDGAQIGAEMNKRYGAAFNKGVRAMANIHGNTWKDSAKDLLDMIDQDWYINDPDGSLLSDEDKQARGGFLDKVVKVESNGRADAKNPNSSATGAAQFVSGTWNTMIDKYMPELRQGRTKEEVLAMRNDPQLSRQMAQHLAEDNTKILKQNKVPVNDTNLYLAHFLGAPTASMVLNLPDKVRLDDLLDEGVLEANSSVLKGKTVGDLKQWAARKMA